MKARAEKCFTLPGMLSVGFKRGVPLEKEISWQSHTRLPSFRSLQIDNKFIIFFFYHFIDRGTAST
jgi:hypothetical protein